MESQAKTIALDTNVLVSIARTKIDVLEEAKKEFGKTEFVVPEQVNKEIGTLEKKGGAIKKACIIARQIIAVHSVKTLQNQERKADNALLELAKTGIAVMTNDKALKKRIKKAHGAIIELSKGHLIKD